MWYMFFPLLQRLLYPPILPGASDGNAGELLILSQEWVGLDVSQIL